MDRYKRGLITGMEMGKIEFSPMSEGTAQNILKRLDRLITLMEEQNDIMLYDICDCDEDDTCCLWGSKRKKING